MTTDYTSIRPGPSFLIGIAALLLIVTGCERSYRDDNTQSNAGERTLSEGSESAEQKNWNLIQAYLDLDDAWHAREGEIARSDFSPEEKERLRTEERGEHPDVTLAVMAARRLAAGGGTHARAAAKFLVEHARNDVPAGWEDKEVGFASLMRLIGPDWTVVAAYNDAYESWEENDVARLEQINSGNEDAGQTLVPVKFPRATEALAAALAILETGPDHAKAREASDFLGDPNRQNLFGMLKAARTLAEKFPQFDNWPEVIENIDRMRSDRTSESIEEFLADTVLTGTHPVARAAARYFQARSLAASVNDPDMDAAQRESRRALILETATGLSVGAENEVFRLGDTFAEAEAAIIHSIRHTVVGATIADEVGLRLDGTEENLSTYAGKVLLMDFWATWCGPCLAALPKLRELNKEYSDDRFQILTISVDDDVETVTRFLEGESMPWDHWYIGVNSDMGKSWQISGYPTYVVIGRDGVILSRGSKVDEAAKVIKEAINGQALESRAHRL